MNKIKTFLVTLVFTSTLYADYEVKQIYEPGDLSQNSYSIFLDNGEILEVDQADQELIETLHQAMLSKSKVSFTKISNNSEQPDIISSAKITKTPQPERINKQMYTRDGFERMGFRTIDPLENAHISTLPSYDHAQRVMNSMNGNTHEDSQCYNRAHMWTYEALALNRVNLGKLWIYFSKKYIREFGHKWWFHVAPYTHVNDEVKRYMLDRGFTKIPYNVENWKNIFIRNKAQCAEIANYTMYERENGTGREYCYLMYSSQYYWQPWQLERLAEKGEQTWGYRQNQMKISYKDALRRKWNKIIPPMPGQPVRGGVSGSTIPTERPREIASYRGFREGTRVLYNNRYRGKVEEVFSDGTALVDLKGAGDVRARIEDLAKQVKYYQGFDDDEDVYDSHGRKGDIDYLFDNGMAIVDIDNYGPDIIVHISTLRRR